MKNIIKILLVFMILITGCTKDYLDINKDPNNPLEPQLALLLTNSQWGLGDALSINGGLSNFAAVYMHQITMREDPDQYGVNGGSYYANAGWSNLYAGPLQDLELIIRQGEENGDLLYAGIAKIMKAYAFSQLVDVYADVPFTEANRVPEILYPVYDQGAQIYPQLLSLLDDAIADLNDTEARNLFVPADDDVIYGGDVDKWIRTANTIKLKLLTQTRLVNDVATSINELLSGDQLITEDFNFELPYGVSKTPDNRNPGSGEYEATQRSYYISPWFYRIMKGQNPNIFTGITDPRIPYYFYNQLKAGQDSREGNPTEYRDGGFVSIYFGSIGRNRDHSTDGSMTVLGLFPVGGRYDDGGAKKVTGDFCTGAAPYRFITYADRLYMEAELVNTNVVAGDARELLEDAMSASFALVDHVVELTQPAKAVQAQTSVPLFSTTRQDTTYIKAILTKYDAAADDSKRLEIIMTQKWIASFGSNVDQWSDYRRTGYPVVFDPNNPSQAPDKLVESPDGPNVGADPEMIPVQLINAYPLSLPWGQDDLGKNPNSPAQKVPANYPVFWDVN
ncbi:MAG: SusD/RagB family nutrient-binding outer membrane lipoprotein [Bacteroidales bacterium]